MARRMMIGRLSIRQYQASDYREILALNAYGLQAAGIAPQGDFYANADFDELENTYSEQAGGCLLVGKEDGKIVAMGGIRKESADACELLRMRVYPEYQGRGYGSAILTLLESEAQRLGYRYIELITGENQHPAVEIYARHGYTIVHREILAGIPSVRMRKPVDGLPSTQY